MVIETVDTEAAEAIIALFKHSSIVFTRSGTVVDRIALPEALIVINSFDNTTAITTFLQRHPNAVEVRRIYALPAEALP